MSLRRTTLQHAKTHPQETHHEWKGAVVVTRDCAAAFQTPHPTQSDEAGNNVMGTQALR